MRIQNNIMAVNSHRQYGINVRNSSGSMERLSSGFRVNRAADDAAGLAISEKMRAQIRGLNRASLNIQDGVSLLQVGDGGLQTVHDMLHRMNELAVQAANGTNDQLDRSAIQLEIDQLISEVNDIAAHTEFNGKPLFDGSIGAHWAWHLGLRTTPMAHDPAIIEGADIFSGPVTISPWNLPPITAGPSGVLSGFGVSGISTLNTLEAGSTFPLHGLFAIQIQTPQHGNLNAVLDFEVANPPPGNFTLAEFIDFFENAFSAFEDILGLAPDDRPIVQSVSVDPTTGQIVLDFPRDPITNAALGIMGLNGQQPVVHIGAGAPQHVSATGMWTNNIGTLNTGMTLTNVPTTHQPVVAEMIPNTARMANSAIFGATPSSVTSPNHNAVASGTSLTAWAEHPLSAAYNATLLTPSIPSSEVLVARPVRVAPITADNQHYQYQLNEEALRLLRDTPHQACGALWDLMSDTISFSVQAERRGWVPTSTGGHWAWPPSAGQVIGIHTMNVGQLRNEMVGGQPVLNLQQASQAFNNARPTGVFTSASITLGSVHVDRDGNIRLGSGTSASATRAAHLGAPDHRTVASGGSNWHNPHTGSAPLPSSPTTPPNTIESVPTGGLPKLVSAFPIAISDSIGEFSITIAGPGLPPRTVSITFSDAMWDTPPADNQTLLNYINAQLNGILGDPGNPLAPPGQPPTFVHRPIAIGAQYPEYDPQSFPIAQAFIENGHLVIRASERHFTISVDERYSDIPMFARTEPAPPTPSAPGAFIDIESVRHGVSPSVTTRVGITGGAFNNVQEFIAANRNNFLPHYILSERDGHLEITSVATGEGNRIMNVTFGPTTPAATAAVTQQIAAALGFPSNSFTEIQYGTTFEDPDPGALWIQSGANQNQGVWIEIPRLCARSLGLEMWRPIDYAHDFFASLMWDQYSDVANVSPGRISEPMGYGINITTQETATNAISVIANAVNIISEERSRIGAMNNRLDFKRGNVDNQSENTQAAESRIRDTDMALEMAMQVKTQILTQASTAMLAQANALPQSVLQLLG